MYKGLSDRKSKSAPGILSSDQGAKKTEKEETGLFCNTESLKSELKDLLSQEKSRSMAEAT